MPQTSAQKVFRVALILPTNMCTDHGLHCTWQFQEPSGRRRQVEDTVKDKPKNHHEFGKKKSVFFLGMQVVWNNHYE